MKKKFSLTANAQFDSALQKMDNQMVLSNNGFATRQNYIRGIRSLMLYYQKLPEA